MATITVIVGDPPYGKERLYSALRFVLAALHEEHSVNLFLFEDAVFGPKKGQNPPEIPVMLDQRMPSCEELLRACLLEGAKIKLCGVCARERGVTQEEILEGIEIATMRDLVQWVVESDKVVSF